MFTQRFNISWLKEEPNSSFFGIFDLITDLEKYVKQKYHSYPMPKMKMLEIGSYMGESTMMFASSNLFSEIHCIDPYQGYENYNHWHGYEWDFVENEFKQNTRYFNNITLYKDFSYNIIDTFDDKTFNFIYIDANHNYDDVKKDIELCLPKLTEDGIISGHDYHQRWPGVIKAVNESIGEPTQTYRDTSWIKYEI